MSAASVCDIVKSSDPENDVAPQIRGAALPGQRLPAGQKLIMLLQNAKPKNFQAVRLPLKHFFYQGVPGLSPKSRRYKKDKFCEIQN